MSFHSKTSTSVSKNRVNSQVQVSELYIIRTHRKFTSCIKTIAVLFALNIFTDLLSSTRNIVYAFRWQCFYIAQNECLKTHRLSLSHAHTLVDACIHVHTWTHTWMHYCAYAQSCSKDVIPWDVQDRQAQTQTKKQKKWVSLNKMRIN